MMLRRLAVAALLASPLALSAQDREKLPRPIPVVELPGYRTTADAIKADPAKFRFDSGSTVARRPGYLGLSLGGTAVGVPVVDEVDVDSAAEKAGFKTGDMVRSIDGQPARTVAAARELLRGRNAGDQLKIVIERDGQEKTLTAFLRPVSKPFDPNAPRAVMGVSAGEPNEKTGGVDLSRVTDGGPASKAGLRSGDVLISINESPIVGATRLTSVLNGFRPGDKVLVRFARDGKEQEAVVTLGADDQADQPRGGAGPGARGWDDRIPRAWTKSSYKLAVIGVEYSDVKHNPKIKDEDWEASLFSTGVYNDKSATGQKVYGSMNDYYKEISYGKFSVDGKFVGWVELPKKRMDYSTGSGVSGREKTQYFTDVFDKYLAKHGKDSLKDFDGVFFVFAGGRVQTTTRGSLYWPHRSTVTHNNKRWPYFIVQEGGERMTDISVFCHEFGHMLGLPDLYARPEVPGMEGVGRWCAMSQQNPQGRPQHFSVWCKEQLGWIKPVLIDPRVKQKLILAPAQAGVNEFYKIPIKPDGSEYLLLENRVKKGFDSDLQAEGLLIWRVIPGNQTQKVFLEEAHGIEGPNGPQLYPAAVPFPSPANTAFTPHTTPSSRSQLGGGLDVYITNIRRLPDGRIAFQIGTEYQ